MGQESSSSGEFTTLSFPNLSSTHRSSKSGTPMARTRPLEQPFVKTMLKKSWVTSNWPKKKAAPYNAAEKESYFQVS